MYKGEIFVSEGCMKEKMNDGDRCKRLKDLGADEMHAWGGMTVSDE
jgi:hypothetical protein